jgi:hypothetical protein
MREAQNFIGLTLTKATALLTVFQMVVYSTGYLQAAWATRVVQQVGDCLLNQQLVTRPLYLSEVGLAIREYILQLSVSGRSEEDIP